MSDDVNIGMLTKVILALISFTVLVFLLRVNPRRGVPAVLTYLAVVGGLRRWLIPMSGYSGNDPLLLVVPAVAFFSFGEILTKGGAFQIGYARPVLWLLCIMLIQVLNPLQGGLVIGIAGMLFYVVPVLWYFIGRKVGDSCVIDSVLQSAVVIACAASCYGLWQTWFGFLPSELLWVKIAGYEALNVGVTRAFSFFTSASEYGCFLGIGTAICWASFLSGRKSRLLCIPILLLGLFLESSRGIMVLTLFSCSVMWAVQSASPRGWFVRGVVALLVGGSGLMWSMGHASSLVYDERVQSLVEHQVAGLTDPFGEESTIPEHLEMVFHGVLLGLKNPIGRGLGSTTTAAGKYGGMQVGTEADFSNMFVSLGMPGGVLYLLVVFWLMRSALHLWRKTRHEIALAIIGVLTVQVGNWLNGGQYSTVMLVWFCLGSCERLLFKVELLNKRRYVEHSLSNENEAHPSYS